MDLPPWLLCWLLVVGACALDRLIGDPPSWRHPVEVMGAAITALRKPAERIFNDQPLPLRLAGALISLLVVGGSGLAGWASEALAQRLPMVGLPLLLLGLASALAGRSLGQAVRGVLEALPDPPLWQNRAIPYTGAESMPLDGDGVEEKDLEPARLRLAWIVGRDVAGLDRRDILRACAETASENAVDGLFAPLFWMLVGAVVWSLALACAGNTPTAAAGKNHLSMILPPGPLALAWMFKASSTLDSMLGYRRGNLRWLGTAGARLDDALTWLPCRLVALGLPLVAGAGAGAGWRQFRQALREGAPDPSPNAGVSQAAYALAAGVRMGGLNHYGGQARAKPVLAEGFAPADRQGVERILTLSQRLEWAWIGVALPGLALPSLARAWGLMGGGGQ
jgi:adenosylcobinamide-phosphate synthase